MRNRRLQTPLNPQEILTHMKYFAILSFFIPFISHAQFVLPESAFPYPDYQTVAVASDGSTYTIGQASLANNIGGYGTVIGFIFRCSNATGYVKIRTYEFGSAGKNIDCSTTYAYIPLNSGNTYDGTNVIGLTPHNSQTSPLGSSMTYSAIIYITYKDRWSNAPSAIPGADIFTSGTDNISTTTNNFDIDLANETQTLWYGIIIFFTTMVFTIWLFRKRK